ncbi:MAG: glmM [Clostridiales bacterium]|jgi:phosphoglucosamine mutase|nr:glmM [Clostridiales bacterium]
MGRLFGTDGVRGVANTELPNELAYQLGRAGAYVLAKETTHKPTIIVGCDTRMSSEMLSLSLISGICSVGANAIYVGVAPTPAVSYLTRKYKADAGVVISASHNPVEFNGIKFFNSEGYKLSDEIENEIEAIILDNSEKLPTPTGVSVGRVAYHYEYVDEYIEFAKSIANVTFDGMKIVLDCANGASSQTSPKAIKDLGAEIIVIHNSPDGTNINKKCGSTYMKDLQKAVLDNQANIGIAFDGDADRMLAVDELGNIVDGDQIMAICGKYLKEQGKLKKNTIVATIMSNLGFFIMGKENDINIEQTIVGDRYVLEKMLQEGYNLGGEQSGHIIYLDANTTGDGLVSAVCLLEVLKTSGKTLSELASVMNVLPQVLVNAKISNEKKNSYMEDEEIKAAIEILEQKFAGEGRVLIRPSGTEPLVRVMIEGKDQEQLQIEAQKLAELIVKKLG